MSLLNNWLNADLFSVLRDKVNAVVTVVNFFAGGATGQIPVKSNATDFNYVLSNSVLPDSGGANIKIKKVLIGDWNMNVDLTKSVAHGLSNYKKILSINLIVRDDADSFYQISPSLDPAGTTIFLTHGLDNSGANVNMTIKAGTFFNTTNFDSTSYNRGFITIMYEA